MVNSDGQRFDDESTYFWVDFGDAVLAQDGAYFIYDQEVLDVKLTGFGAFNKSDSLEELADKLGVNYDNLVASITDYNKMAAQEMENPYSDTTPERVISLDSSAYYGVKFTPALHMTYGGVVVNEMNQIINNSGEVVEGLYASGEVTATFNKYLESISYDIRAAQEIANSLK